jgi:hypothetical protein
VEEQYQLKLLLKKYEHLFDGTFILDPEPISLQLIDPHCIPVHARLCCVPTSMEQ